MCVSASFSNWELMTVFSEIGGCCCREEKEDVSLCLDALEAAVAAVAAAVDAGVGFICCCFRLINVGEVLSTFSMRPLNATLFLEVPRLLVRRTEGWVDVRNLAGLKADFD